MTGRPGVGHSDGSAFARVAAAGAALRRYWSGRRALILTHGISENALGTIAELAMLGVKELAVCCAAPATAESFECAEVWSCDPDRHLSTLEFDAWLGNPPADFIAWLDRLDPDRDLLLLGSPMTSTGEVRGRPVHGWRRPAWAMLEDKTRIDQLWGAVGVPSPAHVVAAVGDPSFAAQVSALDRGFGVVLAGDATRGFVGVTRGLRWVRSDEQCEAALEWFATRTDRIRAAEFLPGVPCSVLAMVLRDGVAVFDPIEIVTLQDRVRSEFVQVGSSTWWRPDSESAEQMRHCTRLVGEAIAETAGYRGMFSIDGILTRSGFAATELNSRHAGGLGLHAGWPEFPINSLQRAVQEKLPGLVDLSASDLEEVVRAAVRGNPSYSLWAPAPPGMDGTAGIESLVTVARPEPFRQTVRYLVEGDRAYLEAVDPHLPDRAAGPAAAALGNALGSTRALTSPRDDAEGS
ncbi:MAG TPA: hypothetical protein VFX70_11930 [Mycobacteriales bacterium]|nr:hypothetical protein [Mycobacteriales bacterium]